MAKRGIDISAHQGNIDLTTLKNNGVEFAIIRVGYGTSGTLDTKFKRNADLCKSIGLPFGFYWYSYALNVEGAKREAEHMIRAIEPYKNDYSYGVWFDMEDADGYKRKNGMPSNQTLREMCAAFCEKLENAGYYTGIYASQSWFSNQLNGSEIKPYDKWMAQWPTSGGKQRGLDVQASERNNLTLWQFTSDGKFNGYSGRLDTNYAYIDYPAIIRGGSTPAPQPKPEIPKKSNEEIAEEVLAGKWGNGDERKERLEAAGYDYNAIQQIVNSKYEDNTPSTTTYVVKSGDTLSGIGAKYGVEWKKIAEVNGIPGPKYIIYPGQRLVIPTGGSKPSSSSTASYKTYKVQAGDTLSGIGAKYGVPWKSIAELNGIKSPYTIYVGQTIKIPNK